MGEAGQSVVPNVRPVQKALETSAHAIGVYPVMSWRFLVVRPSSRPAFLRLLAGYVER